MLEITRRHPKALGSTPPTDAPAWVQSIDNPYLHGLFAPVTQERTATDLVIEGELPRELNGAYLRNGPNNQFAPINRYHWFDGDGMVHGVWFDDGRAHTRNRWVDTVGHRIEVERGAAVWPGVLGPFDFSLPHGPLKDTANTDLVHLGDRVLALWYESGALLELDPATLATRGVFDADGQLPPRLSAHSKVDPATGDLLFFGYGDQPPYMHYGVLRPDGSVHRTDISLPGPRRPHDLGITPRFSILHDFPVFFDPEYFRRTGKRVPLFHREVPTRFGILPRFGTDADVRWFEFEPCYMLHVVNCWEEGDEVVMVGCRTADPTLKPDRADGRIAAMLSGLKLQATLHEWRMDLATGATRERPLDDRFSEFPMIAPGVLGRKNRFAYLSEIPVEIPATFDALLKIDIATGAAQRFAYGPGVFGSEAPFVPRPGGTAEDDGWLVTFVTDTSDWSSACLVFDARDITVGPVAKVRLPARVPAGFHTTWVQGAQWG
ncbi:MAG: carotenoid cleavage dioxygenase-like enzyme [Myxococcota bacterium]|jgi:carotenoid cleavage dioxygenase-like enzyme